MTNPKSHKPSDEEFIKIINSTNNIREALIALNLIPKGGNYTSFIRRAQKLGVDISHLRIRKAQKSFQKTKRQQIIDEQIIDACKNAQSRQHALRLLDLYFNSGSNIRWIKNKIQQLNIDTSHWLGKSYLKGKTHNWSKSVPLEDILKENTFYSSYKLKARLIKEEILENKCFICCIVIWLNQPLSLHLDHINGDHLDNRLENLRLLCPNCHSQTSTYAGKNKGKILNQNEEVKDNVLEQVEIKIVEDDEIIVPKNPNWRHEPKPSQRKVERPTKEELEKLIWEKPTLQLAKQFGVSDKAIEKWCKSYGISKPPRGYWRKLETKS